MRGLNVLVLGIFIVTSLHVFCSYMGAGDQLRSVMSAARLKECDRQMDEVAYHYTFILNNLKSLTPDFGAAKADMESLGQQTAAVEKTLRSLSAEGLTGVRRERFEAVRRDYLLACARMEQMARRAALDFENGALSSEENRYLAEERHRFVQSFKQAKEELKKIIEIGA